MKSIAITMIAVLFTAASPTTLLMTEEAHAPASFSECENQPDLDPSFYSLTGDPGHFGGGVIVTLERSVACQRVRVHFKAEGTPYSGGYGSFEGSFEIGKGETYALQTYLGYHWVYCDNLTILSIEPLPL